MKDEFFKHHEIQVNLKEDYQEYTLLPPIHSDEELVKDYLAHYFIDNDLYD